MVKLTRMKYRWSDDPFHGEKGSYHRTTFNTDWKTTELLTAPRDFFPDAFEMGYLLEIPEEDVLDPDDFPNESSWMQFQVHAQDEELPIYDDYAREIYENAHRDGVPF